MVNEIISTSANLIIDCLVLLFIFKVIKPKNNQRYIYQIEPGLTVLLVITTYFLGLSVFLFSSHINFSKDYSWSELLPFIVNSVIIAPIFEEIVFRKVVLNRILKTKVGKLGAIVITSILFTVTHIIYMYPIFKGYSLLGVFIFSLLVSDLFIRTNNLKLVILIHGATNLIGFFTPKILFYSKNFDVSTKTCIFISVVLVFGFLHRFLVTHKINQKNKKSGSDLRSLPLFLN